MVTKLMGLWLSQKSLGPSVSCVVQLNNPAFCLCMGSCTEGGISYAGPCRNRGDSRAVPTQGRLQGQHHILPTAYPLPVTTYQCYDHPRRLKGHPYPHDHYRRADLTDLPGEAKSTRRGFPGDTRLQNREKCAYVGLMRSYVQSTSAVASGRSCQRGWRG